MVKFYSSLSVLLFCLIGSGKISAQSFAKDSIVPVKEVTVYGNRLDEFDAGVKVLASDSAVKTNFRFSNLGTFLEQNSSLYIKSYGLGSLSTASFRGASASQTAVLWNGFNIQSPMNGTLDLALVPLSLVDQAKVQFGGCGALWGSGAVSGAIHLNNQPIFGKGWSMQYGGSYGSFQNASHQASIGISKRRWIVSLKGFFNDAKNDFSYLNVAQYGEPKQRQTNAAAQQYGYLMDNYFKLNSKNQLNIRIWQQNSDRKIPPTMLVNFSDASQKDWFVRISSEWQHTRKRSVYNVRAAYFDENLLYREASKAIDSYSRSICQISEAETKIRLLENGLLNVGINNTYSIAKVDSYEGTPSQNRSSLFTSFKYSSKKENWKLNVGARKEILTGTRYEKIVEVPWMPFAGADVRLLKKILFKSNVSRNYRLPTFNDLYWTPGGNLNLQPEQGWSEEVGLHFLHKDKECTGENCSPSLTRIASVTLSSTLFNRNIDRWIMWVPQGNYWVPMNILKVWSRGIENSAEISFNLKRVRLNIGGRYDYVLSTSERVSDGSETELHKQLIYVPPHKSSMNIGISYKGYRLNYSHQYTSWVFTQADNKSYIDPYSVGNFVFSKTYSVGNRGMEVNFLLKVNNIWNSQYQVIAYRAMPGRNFEVGVSIQYNQK